MVLGVGRMGISVGDSPQQVVHVFLLFGYSALTEEVYFSLFWLKINSLPPHCP